MPVQWLGVERALLLGWGLRVQHEFGARGGRWANLPSGLAYRAVRSRILKRPTGFFDLHARLSPEPTHGSRHDHRPAASRWT